MLPTGREIGAGEHVEKSGAPEASGVHARGIARLRSLRAMRRSEHGLRYAAPWPYWPKAMTTFLHPSQCPVARASRGEP